MTRPHLVLLVDDDTDLLTVLAAVLRERGYEVALAQDAVAAMSSAVRLRPQAVVLDVGLPGGSGLVLVKRMHALPELAGMPVVLMSGRDPEQYRAEALAAGAAAYLTKPIEPEALAAALGAALGEDLGAEGTAGMTLPPKLKGKVVLLVDDDEDLLVALATALRRQGFDVVHATDAVTAVSTAVKQSPDAIVMDFGLPGGDGITVMQRLHALPRLAAVPIIMVSGRDPEGCRDDALAAGAVAYFAKPVAPEALGAAVTEALLRGAGS
jgi:DNA-binding response OmpR family regulator